MTAKVFVPYSATGLEFYSLVLSIPLHERRSTSTGGLARTSHAPRLPLGRQECPASGLRKESHASDAARLQGEGKEKPSRTHESE